MYLSAHLFHKPKFPELSLSQAVSLMMCRRIPGWAYSRQVMQARTKLDKDLDIKTYLRSVSKVNGLV